MHEIAFACIGGAITMVAYGFTDFLAKINVAKFDGTHILLWTQCVSAGVITVYALLAGHTIDISFVLLPSLFLLGLIDTVGYLLFYKALQVGQVSVITPLICTYSVFSSFISAFFFGEPLGVAKIGVIILIMGGIMLLSLSPRTLNRDSIQTHRLTQGLPYCIVSIALFAIWYPLWNEFIDNHSQWVNTLITYKCAVTLIILAIMVLKRSPIHINTGNTPFFRHTAPLLFIGVVDAIADLGLVLGFKESNYTSITTVLASSSIFPTLILARVFLKERLHQTQIIGIGIIACGIILINYLYH